MNEGTKFVWPENEAEAAGLARSMFIRACVGNARHWLAYGSDLVTRPEPEKPFIRPWNAAAKQDRAYREAFSTLTDSQQAKVLELLEHCIRGAVFSTLCTLDQFPHGEAEVFVWDGVCGEGTRRFRIAPETAELHHDFAAAFHSPPPG